MWSILPPQNSMPEHGRMNARSEGVECGRHRHNSEDRSRDRDRRDCNHTPSRVLDANQLRDHAPSGSYVGPRGFGVLRGST